MVDRVGTSVRGAFQILDRNADKVLDEKDGLKTDGVKVDARAFDQLVGEDYLDVQADRARTELEYAQLDYTRLLSCPVRAPGLADRAWHNVRGMGHMALHIIWLLFSVPMPRYTPDCVDQHEDYSAELVDAKQRLDDCQAAYNAARECPSDDDRQIAKMLWRDIVAPRLVLLKPKTDVDPRPCDQY